MPKADDAPRYTCCLCLSNQVSSTEHACDDCREVFLLPDDRKAPTSAPGRTAIGPTDV